MSKPVLIYIGDKTQVIPGVPLRDLTKEEVEPYGEKALIASGLYEKPTRTKKATKDGE